MTTTTSAMTTRSLLSTGPEMGRGQASLWTAAAAPDHRLWTTLRGPLDPSSLPTCPLPRRRRRASRYLSITTNQRRDDLLQAPVGEAALVNINSPQTGGPSPSIELGHTGLSKPRRPAGLQAAGSHQHSEQCCPMGCRLVRRELLQCHAAARSAGPGDWRPQGPARWIVGDPPKLAPHRLATRVAPGYRGPVRWRPVCHVGRVGTPSDAASPPTDSTDPPGLSWRSIFAQRASLSPDQRCCRCDASLQRFQAQARGGPRLRAASMSPAGVRLQARAQSGHDVRP